MRLYLTFSILYSVLLGLTSDAEESSNGFIFSGNDLGNKITFNNPGFELKEINKNGSTFFKPEMNNAGSMSSSGDPFLPSVSTYYLVEPGKRYSVNVIVKNKEVINNVDLGYVDSWDSQENNVGFPSEINTNATIIYPADLAVVSEPIIMRDVVVVQLTITPFQYNAEAPMPNPNE